MNEGDNGPVEFFLAQNYPNPFNPQTTLRYSLPHEVFVTLTVYNALGQEFERLVSQQQKAGDYSVVFRGEGLASGVYYCRMHADRFTASKKFLLIR